MNGESQQLCTKCVLNSSYPGITFDSEGVCSVCTGYAERHNLSDANTVDYIAQRKILDRLCADAKKKNRQFDVLVPLSGGKDSMYVLYLAVKELGLRVLAYTMDNGYLTDYAKRNIDRACSILGVEHVYYCMDPKLMRSLFKLFINKTGYFCSICMRAIGMTTERIAEMYDIPLVFGGSAAKVELPVAKEMFQPGQIDFVRNVFKGEKLPEGAERLLYTGNLKRRIGYRLFWWGSQKRVHLCAWINLPDYIEWHYDTMYNTIQKELGWESPSGKAEEHIDCGIHKASAYIHNRRWKGSEIPRLTSAGLIMAGQLDRDAALEDLANKRYEYADSDLEPLLTDIGMTRDEFDHLLDLGPRYIQYRTQASQTFSVIRNMKRKLFRIAGIRR